MIHKVLIIGGRERGLYLIKKILLDQFTIHGFIIMEEDDHEVNYSKEIAQLLDNNNIPNVTGKSFKSERISSFLRNVEPDCVLVENWRTIIPDTFIHGVKYFVIFHESLLPKYRGFAPLAWPIINGENETGVTMFFISDRVDAGDIIDQVKISVNSKDTVNELFFKTFDAYWDLIRKNLPLLLNGHINPVRQDESKATYSCMRTPEDGKIDWCNRTNDIINLIRALAPPLMPGAFFYYKDQQIVVSEAEIWQDPPSYIGRIPGRIVEIASSHVAVLTGDGLLLIKKVLFNNEEYKAHEVLNQMKVKLK